VVVVVVVFRTSCWKSVSFTFVVATGRLALVLVIFKCDLKRGYD